MEVRYCRNCAKDQEVHIFEKTGPVCTVCYVPIRLELNPPRQPAVPYEKQRAPA